MTNIVVALILAAIVAGAALYIYKAKKDGQACIGCPNSKKCGSKNCSCGCLEKESDNS